MGHGNVHDVFKDELALADYSTTENAQASTLKTNVFLFECAQL